MFFIPLFDDNPTGRVPVITWSLMALCVAVFLFQLGLDDESQRRFLFSYGAIPALITGAELRPSAFADLPDLATLVTSAFLHGGFLHLGGNMLYLWIFGDNVEEAMGAVKFTIFYIICGAVAVLAHTAIDPDSVTPLVGASGAIAGVLAAYLMLYPRAQVRVLVIILIFVRFISLPAVAVLAGWLLLQFLSAPAAFSGGSGVAYFAHIGGFAAGLVLTPFFKNRDHAIFPAKEGAADRRLKIMSRHQIRNEFVERYRPQRPPRHKKPSPRSSRRDLPQVRRPRPRPPKN